MTPINYRIKAAKALQFREYTLSNFWLLIHADPNEDYEGEAVDAWNKYQQNLYMMGISIA